MSRYAIDMARMRKMENDGNYTLEGIIASKRHHLLHNDDQNILIFGDDKAIQRLAATNTIHADGTFSCVLPGFAQLYIFHATVENNVSLPVLFCLVKGRDEQTYTKLLGMVEELAAKEGLTVWNRKVELMCDFELALINAVHQRYTSVVVRCCFFHFVQNVRKNATKIITAVKRTTGKRSDKRWLAEKTKRRLMLLPLVPKELITPALVKLIISGWKDGCKELPDAFNELEKIILGTYVGKPVEGSSATRPPIYPASLWCVCGLVSRTNNAAESVHRNINSKISGKLTVFKFLRIIEEEMERTNERIAGGCRPETRAVEQVKNQRLAVELEKLLNRKQGVLCFLDNCGLILRSKSIERANKVTRSVISTVDDIAWMLKNRASIVQAAIELHRLICPAGLMGRADVLKDVTRWAFQVPPEPDVHVGPSQVRLSLVDRTINQQYNEQKERYIQDRCVCRTEQSNPTGVQTREETQRQQQRVIYVPIPIAPRVPPFVRFPWFAFGWGQRNWRTCHTFDNYH